MSALCRKGVAVAVLKFAVLAGNCLHFQLSVKFLSLGRRGGCAAIGADCGLALAFGGQ